jgi:hypothetical protein
VLSSLKVPEKKLIHDKAKVGFGSPTGHTPAGFFLLNHHEGF